MQPFGPPDEGPLQGLVASRIETYGGRLQTSTLSTPGGLYPRGDLVLDPSRRRLQGYVPFTKGSGPARGLSPLKLREPEPEKRHGGPFGAGIPHSPKLKEVTKAHQLEVRLHTFSMFGMPRLPPEDRRHWEIGEGSDSGLAIEKSWKELVPGHKEMSRELCHQQEALWELLTTELIYVRKLKIMTDLLAPGLLNLQRVGLLLEVSAETLFGNVPSLIRAHRSFWEEVLGPTLEETRASGQPLDPVSLQNGFLTLAPHPSFPRLLPAPTPVPPVQPALPALRPVLPAREADHGLCPEAAGQQPSLSHLRADRSSGVIPPTHQQAGAPGRRAGELGGCSPAPRALRGSGAIQRGGGEEPASILHPGPDGPHAGGCSRAHQAAAARGARTRERGTRREGSFLLVHLTEFQCVSSALTVHCPSATDRARWLEKTQQAQVALQKLKAEEYIQRKRELLALYRDQDGKPPGTRPSTPSPEGSESSAEGRTPESSTVIPHLVVTEDTDEDAPSVPDDTSDSGYGTLVPGSPKESYSPLNHLHSRALRRDPRLTFSTLDLRDVPLRPQPPDPQAPHRRSAPDLPEGSVRKGDSLPRGDPPTSSEEEDGTSVGENVVVETLHRAQLRGQLSPSPTHADSAGESPWESSGDEEEQGPLFQRPGHSPSPHPHRAEDMLREIREELASQRIEGIPEPGDSRPRKLTRVQLQRMRGIHIVHLDTPLSTSEA
ncbi:pleckstrin homology domain-containing family G member 6 isoform X5 [Hippopotamus amphibius kiboko]|uniref:pleckstrin homology domain-containing family G member 6 isoform X5 n=1 Tax=Hippopotamus amphibius kiboko TaxID=575201 RepID=UPI002598031D|nr:pleckstrin homology domain-containing family G member 6 isoform X5 [Hippopotamus amphibius kiboko]